MNGVLIIGAGGHAKVVADIFLCQGVRVLGFLDDDPSTWGKTLLGLPILGHSSTAQDHAPDGLILGIGDNQARSKLAERVWVAGVPWVTAIHPSATIAASVRLGQGVVVAAGVVINPDTVIGDHVIINTGATVDHDCVIEDYAHIAPGVHLCGGVRMGRGTLVGVGASAVPCVSIGEWAVIGAGAAVVKDIPGHVSAMGVPAVPLNISARI
jgi:sugar O-acyltransferase (sialic acid O-acetyltransferase NeuD family)